MRARVTKALAAVGLSVAMIAGGAAMSASAAEVWYKVTGYSQSECLRVQNQYRASGAHIVTACHYRSYDGKWAFEYSVS
ncbi:hypothetical protein [Agromyces lapidis]|uniref:Secreted protein n=1 Tax=Agromyces lapidis TaxID=279574 RepID=A0ABV5SS86_9MICO|nr:hypothetical protein [Agromyces lapidis]